MAAPECSDAFVFFGATGDLAYKQIFPALQALIRHAQLDMPIIGMACPGWTLDQLRDRGNYPDPAMYQRLRQALVWVVSPLHYFAILPSMSTTVVQGLAGALLC